MQVIDFADWRTQMEARVLAETEALFQRPALTVEDIERIRSEHRGWTQDVQQEGYTAAQNGDSRDANPYGNGPGCNHWIYGYMLGWADRRANARR